MELTQLSMFEFLKVAELRGKSDANKILPVKKSLISYSIMLKSRRVVCIIKFGDDPWISLEVFNKNIPLAQKLWR